MPKPLQAENALVVGNPTMPSVRPAVDKPPQQLASLPGAEREAMQLSLSSEKPSKLFIDAMSSSEGV